MKNPFCPKYRRICFVCNTPCTADEINPAAVAMPEEKPFTGILGTIAKITETVSASTNLTDKASITITAKL